MSGTIEGVDCSYYQGKIDWPRVAAAGKRFAIIRSGDGRFLDPMMEPYIEGALENGLVVAGIYHFLRFQLDPESHADLCLRRWDQAKKLGASHLLWLDWEDPSNYCKTLTVQRRQEWASEFLDSLEKNGDCYDYGHYTGTWWFNPNLGIPVAKLNQQFFNQPLWIGQYPGPLSDPTAQGLEPSLPPGWEDWAIWQYTSSGRVDGIEGNVDLDIAREGFLGLEEDMGLTPEERAILDKIATQGRDTYVQPEGRPEIYMIEVDTLIHIPNPAILLALRGDPADVQVLPLDDPTWKLPTTYPGGVPDLK